MFHLFQLAEYLDLTDDFFESVNTIKYSLDLLDSHFLFGLLVDAQAYLPKTTLSKYFGNFICILYQCPHILLLSFIPNFYIIIIDIKKIR